LAIAIDRFANKAYRMDLMESGFADTGFYLLFIWNGGAGIIA
jgi:hypothetical protein